MPEISEVHRDAMSRATWPNQQPTPPITLGADSDDERDS